MANMTRSSRLIVSSLLLVYLLALAGCAATGGSNAGYLLEQDYRRMSKAQLTAYEQELSDEITRLSATGQGGTSIGFGLGSWGNHTGFGLGVEQALGGGSGGAPVELRDRRETVRSEMRRRGMLPPIAGTP
jgi:hypothetical protein